MDGEVQETAVLGDVSTAGASRAMQHVGPQIKRPSYQHYPVSALPQERPGSTKWPFSGELAMAALVTVAPLSSATRAVQPADSFLWLSQAFSAWGHHWHNQPWHPKALAHSWGGSDCVITPGNLCGPCQPPDRVCYDAAKLVR